MERQTRTELEKIVMIGLSRIDQIIDRLCDEVVTPVIVIEKEPIFTNCWVKHVAGGWVLVDPGITVKTRSMTD